MSVTSATRGRIAVISDVICPWCYIGKRQLGRALPILAAQGQSFAVTWHAFQLNPDMPEGGVDRDEYRARKFGSPDRALEADAKVAEAGAAVGITFRHDLIRRTPNTIAAHRVIWLAGGHGVQDDVVEALFHGYFTEGRDLGDVATLAELAGGAGLDPALVARLFAGEDGRQPVLGEDASARRSGLDGVPTFVMGQYVLFSGAVPAEQMAEAFAKAWKVIGSQAA
jgi:predicted DsbA family dithiol-disulfide isomerase